MIEQIDARCVERMIDDNLLNTCPFEHTHTYSYASKTLIVFFSRYTIDLSKDQRRKKKPKQAIDIYTSIQTNSIDNIEKEKQMIALFKY